MSKNPIINALAALLYIGGVASLVFYVPNTFDQVHSVVVPVAFLSLFVFSAAIMGYIFFYQPLQLYLEGEKKAGVDLFLKTLATFAGSAAIFVLVGLYFATHF